MQLQSTMSFEEQTVNLWLKSQPSGVKMRTLATRHLSHKREQLSDGWGASIRKAQGPWANKPVVIYWQCICSNSLTRRKTGLHLPSFRPIVSQNSAKLKGEMEKASQLFLFCSSSSLAFQTACENLKRSGEKSLFLPKGRPGGSHQQVIHTILSSVPLTTISTRAGALTHIRLKSQGCNAV